MSSYLMIAIKVNGVYLTLNYENKLRAHHCSHKLKGDSERDDSQTLGQICSLSPCSRYDQVGFRENGGRVICTSYRFLPDAFPD